MADGRQRSSLSVAMGLRRRCSADGRSRSANSARWFSSRLLLSPGKSFDTRDLKEAKALVEELGA